MADNPPCWTCPGPVPGFFLAKGLECLTVARAMFRASWGHLTSLLNWPRVQCAPGPFFFLAQRLHRGMTQPDDTLEQALRAQGYTRIAGVDEVGRGPWAGPVVAAAVVFDLARVPEGLNDSKKLSKKARASLEHLILDAAQVCVAQASVAEIDQMNILRASHLAMVRALAGLPQPPDFALIDGNQMPRDMPCPGQTVVKGDGRSVSIAAASIVAKIRRDLGMVALAQQHPGYGWETNMGYGAAKHRAGLEKLGVTPHHRRSFKPIHNMLYQDN